MLCAHCMAAALLSRTLVGARSGGQWEVVFPPQQVFRLRGYMTGSPF